MAVSVDEVSSSLVREYLSRKGFRRTIACMDEEHPRTEASINNRSLLRQILNMEGLYKKNKVQKSPLKTLLEILVKHHIQDKDNVTSSDDSHLLHSPPSVSSTVNSSARMNEVMAGDGSKSSLISKQVQSRSNTDELCPSLENQKSQPLPVSLQDNNRSIRREPAKTASITDSTQRSRTNRIRRGMMAGPVTSTPQESISKRLHRRHEVPQPLLIKREESRLSKDGLSVTASYQNKSETSLMDFSSANSIGGHHELWNAPDKVQGEDCFEKVGHDILKTKKVKPLTIPNMADLDVSELVLDDVDEDNSYLRDFSKVPLQHSIVDLSRTGHPMDQRTAVEIKDVLLGSSLNCFSVEWRNQGFTFSETHDLRYGIVQEKGGPCGVLATVQAFVLKKLMFENIIRGDAVLQRLRPSNTTRRKCLALAISEILWRAGGEKQTTVAINSGVSHFTPAGRYKSEGVLEKITCFTLDDLKDLQLFLEQHIEQFETGGLGCILLTVSAVLSRTIRNVREDMDVPTTTLIGAHGYCTQELVNLLLSGRAVSNVFDNDMELDSGNGNITLLKGMKGSCDIGLLSLFEHYNICKVGTYLKTPRYPIWVVCSESHFSVLFGLQRELLTNQDKSLEFDLYYYDGLANQEEEIRLTVAVGRSASSRQDVDTDLIPPLEHCIQTRWKDAFVSWNDTEPIL